MNCILLLGAGFSRNWGGWLANEAFEYLLGCWQVDAGIRELLWRHKKRGGFEDALAELQGNHRQQANSITEANLRKLQDAIMDMFRDMNAAFEKTDFELGNDDNYSMRKFLLRFDVIFTLNQDQLLERHYLNQNSFFLGVATAFPGWRRCPEPP